VGRAPRLPRGNRSGCPTNHRSCLVNQAPFDLEFPCHIFGRAPAIQRMIRACAETEGLPDAFVAIAVLSAVAATLGKGIEVHVYGNWWSRGNLYILLVARTGFGKSVIEKKTQAALRKVERELRHVWKTETLPNLKVEERKLQASLKHYGSSFMIFVWRWKNCCRRFRQLLQRDGRSTPPGLLSCSMPLNMARRRGIIR